MMTELELQMLGEITVLKHEVAALQELLVALTVTLSEQSVISLHNTATTMDAIRVLTRWTKGEDTANGMRYVIDNIKALSESPPLTALLLEAILHQQAGDALQEPLQSWLAQATPDEIAQDVRQALQQLLAQVKR